MGHEGMGTGTPYWIPAVPVAGFAIALFIAGYQFYAKFLASRVFGVENDDSPTPAHTMRDDVDYSPARKGVLFGHHFASVAGAAPIVGPAIAVIWGWLPALVWVAVGAVFMGAAQDMGALAISARNRGRSIGDLAGGLINPRARTLFLLIVLFGTWIVLAVFALVIAGLFVSYPLTVAPINVEIILAVLIGFAIYKSGGHGALPMSLGAVIFLYALILICSTGNPDNYRPSNWALFSGMSESWVAKKIDAEALADGEEASRALVRRMAVEERRTASAEERAEAFQEAAAQTRYALLTDDAALGKMRAEFDRLWWIAVLFIYCYVACILPVWTLLQPRDYINSHKLLLSLALLYVGFFLAAPFFHAPMFRPSSESGAPPIFPFLFVTVACGAISGFHALVSSGTTSKQLNSFRDVRPIAYGGMIGEASLGIIAVLACTTGLAFAAELKRPEVNMPYTAVDEWMVRYATFAGMEGLSAKMSAFVDGGGGLLAGLFIKMGLEPKPAWEVAKLILAVMVISFAATSLDTAARIQRYVIGELGEAYGMPVLKDRYLSSFIAVGSGYLLAVSGPGGSGGMALWPIFGSLNQLIACLSLLVIWVYLYRAKKPTLYFAIPAILVGGIVFTSLVGEFRHFVWPIFGPPNYFLGAVTGLIMVLALWLALEAFAMMASRRRRSLPIGFQ
jgi:carbon starvation protein